MLEDEQTITRITFNCIGFRIVVVVIGRGLSTIRDIMERNQMSRVRVRDSTQDALCVREKMDSNCLYMPGEPPGPSQRVPEKVCERIVDMFDHVWNLPVEEKESAAKYYADRVHKQEKVLVDTITFLHSHKEIKRGGHPSTSQERSNQKLSIFDIQQCDITSPLKN